MTVASTTHNSILRMQLRFFSLFLFFALAASSVHAQSSDPPSSDTMTVALPEVTVEALRDTETEASAPFTVSTRERSVEEITLEAPVFLRGVLSDLPGVWLNDRGHFALGERLVVRGMGWRSPFGVRGVQALLDGIPLTLPDGQAFLDIADPLFIRRAEAIRGPSSLFWGNGSGGVLFLDSTPDADAPPAQARFGTGSFGLQQVAGEAIVRTGEENQNRWRVAASDIRRDGYRDNSDGRFTRALASGSLPLTASTHLQLVGGFVDQDARNPGSLTQDEVDEDPSQANGLFDGFDAGKQSTQGQLGATVRHEFETASLDATVYGGFRDLKNPLPFAVIAFDRIYGGSRAALSGTSGTLEWNVGADAGIQRDDRVNFDTDIPNQEYTDELTLDQLETVRSASLYGYGRIPIAEQLRLTLGGRGDVIRFALDDRFQDDGVDDSGRRTFSSFSPGVGLAYDLGSALVFANYNTAFETPTTTELVNRPGQPGGFNPDLQPQRTRGLEVGTRGVWAEMRVEYDVAVYQLFVQDRLVQFEIPDSGGRAYFQNVGENTHRGIEASLQWHPRSWLALQTSYTGNRSVFQDDELEGNRVPGVPEHRLFASVTGEANEVWGRLSLDAVSDYYADNENTAVSDGYTLVDIRTGYSGWDIGSVDVRPYAEVSNLFDVQYNGSVSINAGDNYFEPGPGRAYKLGVTVTL